MAMDMWMGRGGWVRVRSESLHERTLLGVCLAFLGTVLGRGIAD
jgi:hypothetical protein